MPRDHRLIASSPGPLRDKYSVTVGTDDIDLDGGFIVQAGSAGDITYRTLFGIADQTETVAAGDTIGIGNHPVPHCSDPRVQHGFLDHCRGALMASRTARYFWWWEDAGMPPPFRPVVPDYILRLHGQPITFSMENITLGSP